MFVALLLVGLSLAFFGSQLEPKIYDFLEVCVAEFVEVKTAIFHLSSFVYVCGRSVHHIQIQSFLDSVVILKSQFRWLPFNQG